MVASEQRWREWREQTPVLRKYAYMNTGCIRPRNEAGVREDLWGTKTPSGRDLSLGQRRRTGSIEFCPPTTASAPRPDRRYLGIPPSRTAARAPGAPSDMTEPRRAPVPEKAGARCLCATLDSGAHRRSAAPSPPTWAGSAGSARSSSASSRASFLATAGPSRRSSIPSPADFLSSPRASRPRACRTIAGAPSGTVSRSLYTARRRLAPRGGLGPRRCA